MSVLRTPDDRYIVVKGRLWRATNPNLSNVERDRLVKDLMDARRRVRSKDPRAQAQARRDVDVAKHGLGERGPAWWKDGAPDYNRRMAENTPYAVWFRSVFESDQASFLEGTPPLPRRSSLRPED